MKVSIQQVNALSQKIYNELEENRKKENRVKIEAYDKLIQAKLSFKINSGLKELWNFNNSRNNIYDNRSIKIFLEEKYKSEFRKLLIPITKLNLNSIKNDIIIETIEAKDIDTLISKIKKKYL